ncbi:MAG: tRNA-2-methylthio-N(6)-dimethylallyladenosine synthase MiaB [Alphaproteobacteria bacterium BRH_c36]|nr:MAG: tRNA-2-methylthio-N(6)-dimethylallyladenosine synthase MiaB [Alphaproteobacteria bacterium BRH_c36]
MAVTTSARRIAMPGTKKVFVKTFGCQMNVYDSERIAESLIPYGFTETDCLEEAEVIVLNTCHIREKAAEKVYSELGRLRQVKEDRRASGKHTIVTVAGCVAQAEGAEIMARSTVVDLVVGPQSYHRLPDLVFRAQSESRRIVDTNFPEDDKFASLPDRSIARPAAPHSARAASAFLTVQEGCDKFCTFCVVPYTRGMEFSRPVDSLLDEARSLISRGVRELTLLGQNVNAYHGAGPDGKDWSLARLIGAIARLDGLERLRYTTSHPHDMSDDLITAHRDEEKLMPYLHLPFQSGSNRILAAMNRKHTVADYLRLIDKIRAARPDIALSTDVIVGFPSETESEFQETLQLIEEVGFAQAFSFKYSPRPGTPAAKIDEQLPEEVKSERLHRLQAVLAFETSRFNEGCVGRVIPVLFERRGRRAGQLVGRSPYLQPVHADGAADLVGRIIPVEISQAGPNSLVGVIRAA